MQIRRVRSGDAPRLVALYEQWGRRGWGCDRMEITSSRARPEAPDFYPALGYEDRCERSARFIRPL